MDYELPQWDVPGWDWAENDYTWLASKSGVRKDGVSIFFIHGGRIRHQGHVPHGHYAVEDFVARIRELAEGLDDPQVIWSDGDVDGDAALWVEGTRPPGEEDLERLRHAREHQDSQDRMAVRHLQRRRPDLFTPASP